MTPAAVLELRVGVDVGAGRHSVAVGLSDGRLLDEFEISHDHEGFQQFFARIEAQTGRSGLPVAVAMEGYNGHARPLDALVLAHDWRLFNINNLKLARFKEIFPGAAKTDRLDARKGLELFQLRDHLPLAKDVLQEVPNTPEANAALKRLTRRRRRLVDERTRIVANLHADLRAVAPGLVDITGALDNLWFLRLLTSTDSLVALARLPRPALLTVKGIGRTYADCIQRWQSHAHFAADAELVGEMIREDAARVLELNDCIAALEAKIATVAEGSEIARLIATIPGFGPVSRAELGAEIGSVDRFRKEASLALYLGMATLDNSSGKVRRAKAPTHVNTRAKAAMMVAVDRHRKLVPASQRYYQKKRASGKTHNQAIRALGRHLCRVIFKMLKEKIPYQPPE